MMILGVCDREFLLSTIEVIGAVPLAAPPRIDEEIIASWKRANIIYIDLHSKEGDRDNLYAGGKPVFHYSTAERLENGKIIFATTCHLTETRFYDIFRDGNVLISGEGRNYGLRERATGAPLLAKWFFRFLRSGYTPEKALKRAKLRLVFSSWRRGDRDALKFTMAPLETGAAGGKNV